MPDIPNPPLPKAPSTPLTPVYQPPPSRPGKGGVIALVVVGLLVFGWIGNLLDSGSGTAGGSSSSTAHSVKYVVGGDSRAADVTFQNSNGDTSQAAGVSVPWGYSFSGAEGDFVYISAQRGGTSGNITCSIEVDGTTVETNTSSGPYTICTASGSL